MLPGEVSLAGPQERAGIKRKMRLIPAHFMAVGHILQTTDLIATLPERFAERLPDIAINLFWHAKFSRDPANK